MRVAIGTITPERYENMLIMTCGEMVIVVDDSLVNIMVDTNERKGKEENDM